MSLDPAGFTYKAGVALDPTIVFAKRKEVKGLYTEAIGDDVDLDRFELGSCGPICQGENSVFSFGF